MKFFYRFGVRLYAFVVRIASFWNPKAKEWMRGRDQVWNDLAAWKRTEHPLYWFHCASLGEFEQGRPLMERLKQEQTCQLVITFFSPSGYEIRKNYEGADLVIYLPRESVKNANRLLDFLQPTAAFFIKYEFWATYLMESKKRGVKLYSIAAVFRDHHLFFKWYGGYMRKVLRLFDFIFVQDEMSKNKLASIGVEAICAGDTRYDRVMENASRVISYPPIAQFIGGEKVLVIGSSWKEDEEVLFNFLKSNRFNWKVIIAPHEINGSHLESIEKEVGLACIRYSNLSSHSTGQERVLIIDNIGMLMNVYQYANIAYVGGAFGKGLHNILEPACFGVPVIFGNNYAKFNEAYDFIQHKIGYSISNTEDFERAFEELRIEDRKDLVLQFMQSKLGATALISDHIKA